MMKLAELTHEGWGDMANYIWKRDNKYVTNKWKDQAVVQPRTEDDVASSARTKFGEPMDTLDNIPRNPQIP